MPEVILNSSRINYEFSRNGEDVIVLLHGFCEDLHIWDLIRPSLEKSFTLLSIDLPGFGGSDVLTGAPSVEAYAEAVLVVLQKEKVSQCYMIGHSMGGYVTLAFAEKYPDMLSGICLFHSQPLADDEARKEARLKARKFVAEVSSSRYVQELMANLFSGGFKQLHPEIVEEIISRYESTNSRGIIYALDAMRTRKDRIKIFTRFNKKVLNLIGEKDEIIPYRKSLGFSYLAPVTDIILLDKSSHMGMIEEPGKCVEAIKTWID